MKHVLAACCLLLISLQAGATTVRAFSVEELAQNSEQIVYGEIRLAQVIRGDCGVRYVVRIEETYKGTWRPATSVLFSSDKSLQVGARYVLFLSKDSQAFSPILSTSSFGPQPDPERVRVCQQNRPLYAVNVWGVGALKVTGTYASKAKMAIYDDFMIRMPKGTKVGKLEPDNRYDMEKEAGGIEFDVLRNLLRNKPAPK